MITLNLPRKVAALNHVAEVIYSRWLHLVIEREQCWHNMLKPEDLSRDGLTN
jgi:hypothetical protein